MRKLLMAAGAAGALGLAVSSGVARADVGTVTQTHTGTVIGCFVANGQWYAIPTGLGGGYLAQYEAVLLAAADHTSVRFEEDPTFPNPYNPTNPLQWLCGGAQPASYVHDIDQVY